MTKTKYAVDAATRRIRFKRKLKLKYSVFTVGLVGNDI